MLFLLLGLFSSQHIIVLTVELVLRFPAEGCSFQDFCPKGFIYFVEIWELPLSWEIYKTAIYYYMLLVLFKLFFTQISQNSRIFYQARNHIIPASSHLSVLSCDVAHRFTQIFTDFYLTTTGTTITTHRSKTDLDLCHLCHLCELLYTNGLELTINYSWIHFW